MSREVDDFVQKVAREVPGFECADFDLFRYFVDELLEGQSCDRRHISQRMADALDALPDNFDH